MTLSLIWPCWTAAAAHSAPRIHRVGDQQAGLRRSELCPRRRHLLTFHGSKVLSRHRGRLRSRLGYARLDTHSPHPGRTQVRTHVALPGEPTFRHYYSFGFQSLYDCLLFFPETLRPSGNTRTLHFIHSAGTELTGETQAAEPEILALRN